MGFIREALSTGTKIVVFVKIKFFLPLCFSRNGDMIVFIGFVCTTLKFHGLLNGVL